jgi:hypothetical protein
MWYFSATDEEPMLALPSGIAAAVDADLRTIGHEDLKPGEPGDPGNALARSKARDASTGPGSEYWLP